MHLHFSSMGHILALKSVSGINPIGFGKAGEVFGDVREGDTVGIECDDGLYGAYSSLCG